MMTGSDTPLCGSLVSGCGRQAFVATEAHRRRGTVDVKRSNSQVWSLQKPKKAVIWLPVGVCAR
jgi:hypothetical protein